MSRKFINGFTYVPSRREAAWTRQEWQARMGKVLAAGGRRRVENGETFVHGPDGKLELEIYANVAAPAVAERDGGEVFRGGEAAGYLAEQQDAARRLK